MHIWKTSFVTLGYKKKKKPKQTHPPSNLISEIILDVKSLVQDIGVPESRQGKQVPREPKRRWQQQLPEAQLWG